MENFKWKNTITTLRNSIDRTIEMTKPEQKREHILEKKKIIIRVPGTVGSIQKTLNLCGKS